MPGIADARRRCPVVDFDHHRPSDEYPPHEVYRQLRETAPVAWSDSHGGFWVVSGYEEVRKAMTDTAHFMSGRDLLEDPGNLGLTIPPLPDYPVQVPEELDNPEAKTYRRILNPVLSPQAAEARDDRILHWTTHCIDEVIERGSCDLVYDFAAPVPAAVVMEWLGMPRDSWNRIARAHHDLAAYPRGHERMLEAYATLEWAHALVHDEVVDRRARPRDDIISYLANQEVDGKPIDLGRAGEMVSILIGGGVDTTTSLVSSTLLHLDERRDQRASLAGADDETWVTATEEFLRRYPPVNTHARTVREDVELGGCQLRRGERVLVSESSACHDGHAFEDPFDVVLDRVPNRHTAFGMGPHRCPGMHLARRTHRIMVRQLLERMPDYKIDHAAVELYPNMATIAGVRNLPATFTPGTTSGGDA